ncbi:MAG: TRAP transporter large permease [Candidatus Limnocylindrales bacterium]
MTDQQAITTQATTAIRGLRTRNTGRSWRAGFSRLNRKLVWATEWIAFFAIAIELAVLFANVVSRSFLGFTLLWSQEVAQLCLSVIAFVGGALAYSRNLHTRVEAGVAGMPAHVRPYLHAAAEWLAILISVLILVFAVPTLPVADGQVSPILGLSGVWFVVPLLVGLALVCLFAFENLLRLPGSVVLWTGLATALLAVLAGLGSPVLASVVGDMGALWMSLAALCVLLFVGVPIGFVLAFASVVYLLLSGQGGYIAVPLAMEGGIDSFVLLAIPFFILAGLVMTQGGLTKSLARAVSAFVGHLRGGLLYATVLTMYIFAGVSGSKAADVAAVGTSMKDMLADGHYNTEESVAVLSASCVMGETVPPSLPMLVLGSVTTLSIGSLFAAGILPAVFIGLFLMALIFVRARMQQMPVSDRVPWAARPRAIVTAIPVLLVPVILIGGIFSGLATATESASIAVVYALVIAVVRRPHMSFSGMRKTFVDGAALGGMVLFIVSASTPFSRTLTEGGIPRDIANAMMNLGGGAIVFLLVSILGLVVMGELLEGLPAVLVFAPLLVPLAPAFGIDPLHYAIVILFAMGIGSFAPPIGVGLYVACAVSGSTMEKSTRRLLPYLAVLVVGVFVLALFPAITLWLPSTMGLVH